MPEIGTIKRIKYGAATAVLCATVSGYAPVPSPSAPTVNTSPFLPQARQGGTSSQMKNFWEREDDYSFKHSDRTFQGEKSWLYDSANRAATEIEGIAGELRSWGLLQQNWDQEGAEAPSSESISSAINFLYAMPASIPMPEPMLSPNGHSGFFWDLDGLYADLEFYED